MSHYRVVRSWAEEMEAEDEREEKTKSGAEAKLTNEELKLDQEGNLEEETKSNGLVLSDKGLG